MGGHAEGLSSKGLSSKVVPVKTPHSSCHQGFQIKSDDLFYVMNGQIKNVNFTMLIPHLDKEGIWQARILSVLIIMMLWITVFLAEVWKCESKLSASGTQTCAKQGESSTWASGQRERKLGGRVLLYCPFCHSSSSWAGQDWRLLQEQWSIYSV